DLGGAGPHRDGGEREDDERDETACVALHARATMHSRRDRVKAAIRDILARGGRMTSRAVALALIVVCTVARADDPRAARQHFAAGSSLFDLGRFREAAAEYEEAYRAKNDPALLFNIG